MAIVTELCSEGSLLEFMKKNDLTFSDKLILALQVVDGLHCMYNDLKLIHRDIAARNILIHRTDDEYLAKVADFEMSKLGEAMIQSVDRLTLRPVAWSAPESLDRAIFTIKTDIYSFGVTLWELFTEENPVEFGRRQLVIPKRWPLSLQVLVSDCLSYDPNQRPENWQVIYDRLLAIKNEMDSSAEAEPMNCNSTWDADMEYVGQITQVNPSDHNSASLGRSSQNRITVTTPPLEANFYQEYNAQLQQILTPTTGYDRALAQRWKPIMEQVTTAMNEGKTEIARGGERIVFSVEGGRIFRLQVFPKKPISSSQQSPSEVFGVRIEIADGDFIRDKAIQLACLAAVRKPSLGNSTTSCQ
jgi:serine/threonine protein kinase